MKDKRLLKKMEAEKKREERKKDKKSFKEHMKDFKDFCVKDTSRMILLVCILIVAYFVLNLFMADKQLAQIDLTTGRVHSLTDRSKEVAKGVDKDITFYLWKINENDGIPDIIRQYTQVNSKIKLYMVSADDKELIKKYAFEADYPSIVGVSSNGHVSYISNGDLFTYDDDFTVVDLSEQKLTNALIYLNNDKQYKVYALAGKSTYTLENGINGLAQYLQADNYQVEALNIMEKGAVPDDCDILLIFGLSEDLNSFETDSIINYIAKGGDMIIANDNDFVNTSRSLPNFDKVLDQFCMKLPNMMVQEHSSEKIINAANNGLTFKGTIVGDHEITRLLKNYGAWPLLTGVGPIELDYTKAVETNVTPIPLVVTSNKAIAADLANQTASDEQQLTVIAAAIKTSDSGQESRLVLFGNAESFSDSLYVDEYNSEYIKYIEYSPNASIMLNSFAYVSNQGELYSIRKTTSDKRFVATKEQSRKVLGIIAFVPVLVACIGVVVCNKRRKLK